MVKIHYFFDPMCGWCFGATSLIEAIKETRGIQLDMHPGGMIERREMDASFRKIVLSHDKKIESITGQYFGNAYKKRVSGGESIILDSFLTAQAIVVMEQLADKGFEMLKAIQIAHYQRGLDVSDISVLDGLAVGLGIKRSLWQQTISMNEPSIDTIITDSRERMNLWQVNGFPTLIVETDSEIKQVYHTQFYNNIAGWKEWLMAITASQ